MTAVTARARSLATGPLFVLIVTGLVGFLLVSQFGATQRFSQRLAAENEGDLARILAGLNEEADALRDEIGTLTLQMRDLETSTRDDAAAAESAEEQLRALEVLAGTVPVAGPGISLTVVDPAGQVRYETIVDIVQELRDAGAEAIAINTSRIGVATALAERDGKVIVDGRALAPPYRVVAIGQATTLEGGLNIPGGAVDAISSLKGVRVEVQKQARVEVPALTRPPELDVAEPVPRSSN